MRLIKMFGLTAIAAIAAMAFLGATSAMAENTALCNIDAASEPSEECPEANLVEHVHFETQKLENGVLVPQKGKLLTGTFGVTVECVALFLGNVVSPFLGSPLELTGNLSYSSCGGGCSVTELSSGGTILVLKEGHELASVRGDGFRVLVNCGLGVLHCVYNGNGLVGHGLGPLLSSHNGHVTFSDATVTKDTGGILCPPTSKLDADFLPLANESLYLGT